MRHEEVARAKEDRCDESERSRAICVAEVAHQTCGKVLAKDSTTPDGVGLEQREAEVARQAWPKERKAVYAPRRQGAGDDAEARQEPARCASILVGANSGHNPSLLLMIV